MSDAVAALRAEMAAAAAALDFERARLLRDRIALLRGHADAVDDTGGNMEADLAGVERQQPGRMGLGTGQPVVAPPDGWVKPRKPDPMTRNHRGGGRR